MAWSTWRVRYGLEPGNYGVTVTDENGCSVTDTVEVEAAVAINLGTTVTDVTCFGDSNGSASVEATGGSGNFQYSINGIIYNTSNVFDGLLAGQYSLFAQDEIGCVESTTVTVEQPDAIEITAILSEAAFDGQGVIDATVIGGTPSIRIRVVRGRAQSTNDPRLGRIVFRPIHLGSDRCQWMLGISIVHPDDLDGGMHRPDGLQLRAWCVRRRWQLRLQLHRLHQPDSLQLQSGGHCGRRFVRVLHPGMCQHRTGRVVHAGIRCTLRAR